MTNFITNLSKRTGVSPYTLVHYLSTAHHRYKVFYIDKRNSDDKRKIAQPSKGLKALQRQAIDMLGLKSLCHSSAMAYVNGLSIKDNAEAHKHGAFMLKMDFKNFFPSIKPLDFLYRLNEIGNIDLSNASREDKILIARLFFFLPKRGGELELSIGAPSSPDISNFVMREFDTQLNDFCSERSVKYTRYADDLAFSCSEKGVLKHVEAYVYEYCRMAESPRLTVNENKTVHTSKKHNRHVTGITITNDGTLSLGRVRKRELSSGVHHYSESRLSPNEAAVLAGWLRFASHIEPDFMTRLKRKYGEQVLFQLLHENSGQKKFKR